ncbi:hypothetical protein HYX13_00170 [Candidatus Woesearchaeota archaeon]|nr:hypothetical protein [Candidatus Woesearchaeota archaeon]
MAINSNKVNHKSQTKTKFICNLMEAFLLLFLLALPLATATGIRPAKTTILSEESHDYVGQFWVVNNDHREFSVQISVEGEMSQYLTLQTKELHFRADDDALSAAFEIHLPLEIPPGESTASIVVEENFGGSGDSISSKVLLKHKIIVKGPYPDKYVETKLNFHEQGKEIAFVSEVTNLGKEDLQEVQTTFYVNDKQQLPQVKETEKTSLAKNENKLLTTSLPRELFTQGEFEVSAVTTFDDQKIELTKTLLVGQPEVDITYFDKYFVAYKVNQYSLDLLNKWNKEIKNVFVDVEVKKDDKKIDAFRTRSLDIPGEMMKRISDYLNAEDKIPGKYTFEMAVNFWNLVRNDQKKFVFESEFLTEEKLEQVKEGKKSLETMPLVGAATAEQQKTSGVKIVMWIFAGVFLGAAGFYVLWRYKHRKEYEDGEMPI